MDTSEKDMQGIQAIKKLPISFIICYVCKIFIEF